MEVKVPTEQQVLLTIVWSEVPVYDPLFFPFPGVRMD